MEKPKLPDYYENLGVEPQSTVQDIKKAFHRLARIHHPDKQGPGKCGDAAEFRKVREAQEALCDENTRREYDMIYQTIRLQWIQYRKEKDIQRVREELKMAEEEKIRRRAKEEATKRRAEAERVFKLREEARLLAERAERERLRAQKERAADERSREAGRKAREHQEREARERLWKEKERKAEERSNEAANKWREQQDREAKKRLVQILIDERQETIRRNWTTTREQAESRHSNPATVRGPTVNQAESRPTIKCNHLQVGWLRENGRSRCIFCKKKCTIFSFRCPGCNAAACGPCKKERYLS